MKMNGMIGLMVMMCLIGWTNGIVREVTSSENKMYYLGGSSNSFGALKDAEWSSEITVKYESERRGNESKEMSLLVCKFSEYSKNWGWGSRDPCLVGITQETCSFVVNLNGSSLSSSGVILEKDIYYLVLANCFYDLPPYLNNLIVFYSFVNPDSEHLEYGEIPLPSLFIVLTVIWSLVFVGWCFNWIQHRDQPSVALHTAISAFPFTKLAWTTFGIVYWNIKSSNGDVASPLVLVYWILYILLRASFFGILLLVASGWKITKLSLGKTKFVIPFVLLGLTSTLAFGLYFYGFVLLISFLVYVVIIVMIFRYVNENLLLLWNNEDETEEDEALHARGRNITQEKMKMFKKFKIIILGYICSVMMIVLLQIFFLYNHRWIVDSLDELLELGVFLCIAFTFRLRPSNIYYRLSEGESPQISQDEEEMADRPMENDSESQSNDASHEQETDEATVPPQPTS